MKDKPTLQAVLGDIMTSVGESTTQVYFQPPESVKMTYPAIRYSIDGLTNNFANGQVYNQSWHYKVTVIDKKPTSIIAQKVSKLPTVQMVGAPYVVDNLYHYVFRIYY